MAVASAIDFGKKFGSAALATAAATTASNRQQDKVPAQFWLNVGYLTDVKDDQGEFRFVSLAQGIPLDTMETVKTNSRNVAFAQFQGARNDLRDQLVAEAAKLAPGASVIIGDIGGLQLQIRRVSEETAVSTGNENPFSRVINFGVAPASEESAA